MKSNPIAMSNIYLGAEKISKARLPTNGTEAWAMSSSKHVQEAIKNAKAWLEKRDRKLLSRCSTPLPPSYRLELLDISPELNADDPNSFQSVNGVLQWAKLNSVMWKLLPKYLCYRITLHCPVQDTLLVPSISSCILKRNTMSEWYSSHVSGC